MRRATTMTLVLGSLLLMSGLAQTALADAVYGCGDVLATGNKGTITHIRYDGITYPTTELVCGTTTLYNASGVEQTSTWPLPGADDFSFDQTVHSTDNCQYLKTMFNVYSTTFFVFENNGNDDADWYRIDGDGSLGPKVSVDASAVAANTGYTTGIGGQKLKGYCLETDVPVKGLKIVGSGFDAYSISCYPIPEPTTAALLGLGGLAAIRRRRRRV
ncbi:MAG: PEP-CTERM sorting domain-containing protein [Planctomycetota bacterium]